MGNRGARRWVAIAAAAAGAALIPASSAAAGTLDQQQTVSNFGGIGVDNTFSRAQTFTAGLSGQLDQVDLALSGMSLTTPLTVQIRDGSATTPGDTVLATASVPTSAVLTVESFVPVTFTSPASVTAGTQYSIVAFNNSVGWVWHRGQTPVTSAYVGGKGYGSLGGLGAGPWSEGNPDADFEFKTYVAPPPPPTAGGGDTTTTPSTTKKCKKGRKLKKGKCVKKKRKKRR